MIALRFATPDDIGTLQAIDKSARSRYAALPEYSFVAASAPIGAARFTGGETLVAEINNAPVGFALMQPLDGLLYLANISVTPEVGQQGVGFALLQRVCDRAAEWKVPAVTLTTFKAPRWNGPWFRRHGFVAVPEARIGPGLRSVLARQSTFLDKTTRETLWKDLR